ncbi:MAG: thiamine pyrophosphate-dependent dehydrogenase E1 component subunit alpha [Candidatus Paceibacterota bacterium]
MIMIRLFEERVADLVEEDRIPTPCHFCIGQEAAAVGVCESLQREDTVWGAHRSHGHYLAKGGDLKKLMAEIFCRATGCSGGRGGSMHVIDQSVGVMGTVPIVAATIPIAVGAALAAKLRGGNEVAVSFFGDGATEEGHFHESLNFAGINNLPVIFVCENNLYSSHMGIFQRRRKDNIIESATTHGITGHRVDGNDVQTVRKVTTEVVAEARRGDGPALLELRTFRWRGHVGPKWDEDVGVKRKGELSQWLPFDPIARCERELLEDGVSQAALEATRNRVAAKIHEAVAFAERSPMPLPETVNNNVYRIAG